MRDRQVFLRFVVAMNGAALYLLSLATMERSSTLYNLLESEPTQHIGSARETHGEDALKDVTPTPGMWVTHKVGQD